MGRMLLCVCLLVFVTVKELSGIMIRNKLLGKCLQVPGHPAGGRVSLGECDPNSPLQEWVWLPEGRALSSHYTGECLSALGEQYEGVYMQPCVFKAQNDKAGDGEAAVDTNRDTSSQAWVCSRKGHIALMGKGLHLSAAQQSSLVFLTREHNQGSRWQGLDNKTLCSGRDGKHSQHPDQPRHSQEKSSEQGFTQSEISDEHKQAVPSEHIIGVEVPETYSVINLNLSSLETEHPSDPTRIFFSIYYGMAWKITMLVLSSLGLVLGTVILIFNVYSNRRKKVVCVLKSYKPRPEMSVPGSPMPSERAPLTEHAMCLPHSSTTLQRGEILIEWKDGSVTPLYEG